MASQVWAAVHVQDVAANTAFFIEKLGWALDRYGPDGSVAHLVDGDGYGVLLVGPDSGDVSAYLDQPHATFYSGQTIRVPGGDLAAQRAMLLARGLKDAHISDTPWGDRCLDVPALEGYRWRFVAPVPLSPE